jgi:hypothetical protein
VDAGFATDERVILRTAKSRGPDPPTLGSSLVENLQGDGGKKARLTGESAKETVKTIRVRECRVIPENLWSTNSCVYFCTRGRGCNGHPAFPTPSGRMEVHGSGKSCRENANVCFVASLRGTNAKNERHEPI